MRRISAKTAVGNRQSAVDGLNSLAEIGSGHSAVDDHPIADCRVPIADLRARVVAVARSWIGTPYRHQGCLKGVGCDCLGLLIGVWRELGGEGALPALNYTRDWAEANGRDTLAEGLRFRLREIEPVAAGAGDVVLFRWRPHLPAKHAAILTEPGRMVHAQEKAAVTEAPLGGWWRRRIAFAFALPPETRR